MRSMCVSKASIMAPIVVSALIEQFVIETGDITVKVVLGAAAIFGRHCIGSGEKWCPLFVDSLFCNL